MLSQEFIIQNHADIISCVCMVIFMLLIPQVSELLPAYRDELCQCYLSLQATNPYASWLIFIHNNISSPIEKEVTGGVCACVSVCVCVCVSVCVCVHARV